MRDLQQPGRSVVMSTRGMVATSQPAATQTGLEVLQRGGNAMDAAVAAAAVLGVCEPASTGIGGDCFVLYHDARTDKLFGLNGSGRAPRKATPEELRGRGHETMPESGILSVTVPGAVHAWETALDRFGTQGLADALAPAIRYAEEGCAVTPVVGRAWRLGEALLVLAQGRLDPCPLRGLEIRIDWADDARIGPGFGAVQESLLQVSEQQRRLESAVDSQTRTLRWLVGAIFFSLAATVFVVAAMIR